MTPQCEDTRHCPPFFMDRELLFSLYEEDITFLEGPKPRCIKNKTYRDTPDVQPRQGYGEALTNRCFDLDFGLQ